MKKTEIHDITKHLFESDYMQALGITVRQPNGILRRASTSKSQTCLKRVARLMRCVLSRFSFIKLPVWTPSFCVHLYCSVECRALVCRMLRKWWVYRTVRKRSMPRRYGRDRRVAHGSARGLRADPSHRERDLRWCVQGKITERVCLCQWRDSSQI